MCAVLKVQLKTNGRADFSLLCHWFFLYINLSRKDFFMPKINRKKCLNSQTHDDLAYSNDENSKHAI